MQALNHKLRNIISILNRHHVGDELKKSNRSRPEIKNNRESSQEAGLGIDNLFRSEEELEAYALLNEKKEELKEAQDKIQDLTVKNEGLMRENGQMRIDMNRAVIELEQLVKQLGELKNQVNDLQKENKALKRAQQASDKIEDDNQDVNDDNSDDDSEWDEEGNRVRRGTRGSFCELEEEASTIGANLVDALQKYKSGAALEVDRQGTTNGDVDTAKGKKSGGFGLFGLGRNRGAVQTPEGREHLDERNTSESDVGSHHSHEGKPRGTGVLGGLFGRADSDRSNNENKASNPIANESSPESVNRRRQSLFRAFNRNNPPNQAAASDDEAPKRKAFGVIRRGLSLRGRQGLKNDLTEEREEGMA